MSIHRVLLAGYYQYEWYEEAWARGLEAIGVEVVRFNWTSLFSSGFLGRFEKHFFLGPGLLRINWRLVRTAAEVEPDVVLIYAGLPIHPWTVKYLAERYRVAGYTNDNPFGRFGRRMYWFRKSIPYYSSHHVYRQENIDDYREMGVRHVRLLMAYYVPWLHFPLEEQGGNAEHRYGIVFIGHAEPDQRISYIQCLIDAHLPLRVFGGTELWKRYLPHHVYARLDPIVPIYGLNYARTITASRISLCFLSRGNRDQYTRRCFEIPACKGFLLAERTPVLQRLYEEGSEAEYFDSEAELLEKAQYYLSHEDERRSIAERGYQRCIRSGYDVVSRMKQWLADTEGMMSQ